MSKAIIDQFSGLSISRQRKYQLRHKLQGKCIVCAAEAVPGLCHCANHLVARRERQRKKLKSKRRNYCAPSYQFKGGLR